MKYLSIVLLLIGLSACTEPNHSTDAQHHHHKATTSDTGAALDVTNAIVPEAPPTAKVLTAYMQLHNTSDKEQTVVAISSPQFERIEMHKTEIIDDIASMKPIELIRIPAQGMAELKSGGMHLMMYQPDARYTDGDCVELILKLGSGETQSVRATVEKREQEEDHSHHHHH